MPDSARTFLRGFRISLPLVAGTLPFGILYGTLATAAGFPWWLILFFSMAVFGGSSQLVFLDLFQHLGSPLQATLGSNIVNARHLIYSAGVSQQVSHFPLRWRLLISYLLTDQLYAISQSRAEEIEAMPSRLAPWFFFGSGACTWVSWIISNGLGIAFGSLVPASWNLGFSIPLIFMPLIFTVAKSRFAYLACAFALVLVCFLKEIPFGLGVFLSILLSSFLGFLVEKAWRKKR